jgi:hypothetical protein
VAKMDSMQFSHVGGPATFRGCLGACEEDASCLAWRVEHSLAGSKHSVNNSCGTEGQGRTGVTGQSLLQCRTVPEGDSFGVLTATLCASISPSSNPGPVPSQVTLSSAQNIPCVGSQPTHSQGGGNRTCTAILETVYSSSSVTLAPNNKNICSYKHRNTNAHGSRTPHGKQETTPRPPAGEWMHRTHLSTQQNTVQL